jgi:hypothetical protein
LAKKDGAMNARWIYVPALCLAMAAGHAAGQAVQLPTFRSFGVSTTVVVPDNGSGFLGGIDSAASGRTELGTPLAPFPPLRNAAAGSQVSSGGARVFATVHDFAAMDQRLLGEAGSPTPSVPIATNQPPLRVPPSLAWTKKTQPLAESSASRPAASVGQLRAQHAAEQLAKSSEAHELFDQGQRLEASGKPNVARIYYQMAVRRASGDLKDRIDARLRTISPPLFQASPPSQVRR